MTDAVNGDFSQWFNSIDDCSEEIIIVTESTRMADVNFVFLNISLPIAYIERYEQNNQYSIV